MAGTDSWFRSPQARVSAHYGVSRKGEVVEWVSPEDQAWHAGTLDKPTAAIVKERGGRNPNEYSIGLEFEGMATDEPTPAQMVAGAELVVYLAQRYGIPVDETHVIPHRAIRASKTCPGKIRVEELLALARRAAPPAPAPARPQPGDSRWSDYLGERLILTEYIDDKNYRYLRASQLRGLGTPGTARWSALRPL